MRPLSRELVDGLAADVGRLRKRVDDPYSVHLVERIASAVEVIDSAVCSATAAELYREWFVDCLNEDVAVGAALGAVELRARELRRLLGEKVPA